MGQSTDAVLFFGFDLGEDFALPWKQGGDDDLSWEEAYAEKKGLEYPRHLSGLSEWTEEQSKEYRAYSEKKSEIVKAVGVDVSSHCSCEYPMYYVYTRQHMASRGYPEVIDRSMLEVEPEDVTKLREFCRFMGIDVGDKDPQWFLASDWC